MSVLTGSAILVTGGTGSFGKAFLDYALAKLDPARLIVFSRDELKQYEVRQQFRDDPRLRWFIGDVRDERRLQRAMHGVDFVVHAAALKQVDTAEYNPVEFVRTNVFGSQNVIEAAIDSGVQKVVALSTDKASSPINLYGATKLTADKLFVSGNHYAAHHPTRFSVVRYGNVMGSRGSVIPFFRRLAAEGRPLPITDLRCTRFFITLAQAVEFVVDSFDTMQGGELFVPRIPSMRITDLARAIAPDAELVDVGLRPGEKLHEEMISPEEAAAPCAWATATSSSPTARRGATAPPRAASRCPTGSPTARTPTTSGSPRSRSTGCSARSSEVGEGVLPYGRQSVDDADVAAVLDVLRGDWLTTGPAVTAFEDALADVAGVPHAVAVSSGTAALHVAYACLGLRPGDQVVTTPMTFVATAACASQVGAEVVFADVDPETGLLDPDAVAAAVTPRTRVVAAVDYAGLPADHDRLREVAREADAVLLDDAAHSVGGTLRGRPVGSLADVTTFSFFPTKNLTTAEGGAVVTADAALARRCREFRTVGLVRDPDRFALASEGAWHQEVHSFGLNYRLSDLGAALGLSQLRRLPAFVARRRSWWSATAATSRVSPTRARSPCPSDRPTATRPGTCSRCGSCTVAAGRPTTACGRGGPACR